MNNTRLPLGLFFASISCLAGQPSLIGEVQDRGIIRGCSWHATASSLKNGVIFLAERDESIIIMNIDAADVRLQVTEKSGKLQARGDVLERTYVAPGITVKARYIVTSDCSASASEACEVIGFTATFKVSKSGQFQTIQASGESGC
jgi:hypothetical protein